MITFTHNGKSISLGPSMIFSNGLFEDIKNKFATDKTIKNYDENNITKGNKSKILKIDGILHSLHEAKSTSKHNLSHDKGNRLDDALIIIYFKNKYCNNISDYVRGMMNDSRIMKREAKKKEDIDDN